jgi:formylglycine-generating enzyme required for sulfatase activity
MGCSPGDQSCNNFEKPVHTVTISKGFWMGQTPVTVNAYRSFASVTGRVMPPEPVRGSLRLNPDWGEGAQPMTMVTWDDATAYCKGTGGRLPTGAEWEYAARAGTTGSSYGNLDDIAWYADNSGRQHIDSDKLLRSLPLPTRGPEYSKRMEENGNAPHAVGKKLPNAFHLYDMLGNVYQWVSDWYDKDYYGVSPSVDPAGPTSGQFREFRGGAWPSRPWGVRVSDRSGEQLSFRRFTHGFRCVREMTP